jgi:hypothetical protein
VGPAFAWRQELRMHRRRSGAAMTGIALESVLTCRGCGHANEAMPVDAPGQFGRCCARSRATAASAAPMARSSARPCSSHRRAAANQSLDIATVARSSICAGAGNKAQPPTPTKRFPTRPLPN